ncbi:MAG: serine hydrolase [Clostridiales bacterium]|nr:serine hydrolase [Clostridiales bacterium]
MNMTAILEKAAALPGKIGVYVLDTVTGEEGAYQADLPLQSASVIKIPVMVEAFRRFASGELDENEVVTIRPEHKKPSCGALTYLHDGLQVTLLDLVTLMIIVSDNTATNLMIDRLGIDAINATSESLGLTGTRVNRRLYEPELSRRGVQNYVSAADMGKVLQGLLKGEIISEEASLRMLNILKDQRLNGKMPFFLHDKGIRCAHKTGEDDGITHDVGVIFAEHPVIFCFLSNETDVPLAERALQDMAAMAAGVSI